MGVSIEVFQPVGCFNGMASGTASRVQVATNPGRRKIRFASPTGSGDYWVKFGDASVVADATTSTLVLGGTVEIFTLDANQSYVSLLAVSTSASVNIRTGSGS